MAVGSCRLPLLHTRSPSLVCARPEGFQKRLAARLLARQAASASGLVSLRAATNLTPRWFTSLGTIFEAIASTPPGSMQRPAVTMSGTSASCRSLLGTTKRHLRSCLLPSELKSWGSRSGDSKTSTHHDGSGATSAMRASALFLSSGELSQASTANCKSCACESLSRRDGRLMTRCHPWLHRP
eukprot:scaffold76200_cov63-Phaeocystis_antarctica.AAC.1